jgi:hypothetical protein
MPERRQLGDSTAKSLSAEVGITMAPATLNKTRAERLASDLANGAQPAGTRTKEEAAQREEISRVARRDLHGAMLRARESPWQRSSATRTHATRTR